MRKLSLIICFLTAFLSAARAQITVTDNRLAKAQYWFDATTPTGAVTVSNLTYDSDSLIASVNIPNVDVSALAQGRHILYLRFQDKNGRWGEPTTTFFYINNPPVQNRIVKGQYWFDAVNPPGNAVLVDTTTTDADDITFFKNLSVDVSALSNGSHTLYFRMLDKNGKWGPAMTSLFRKAAPVAEKRIAKGEYWFNSVSRPASGVTDLTATIRSSDSTIADVSNQSITLPGTLTNGRHTLYVRFQDSQGNWGAPVGQQFVIDQSSAPPLITEMEYFFESSDPGAGNATKPRAGTFALTNGSRGATYADSFSVQALALSLGQHKISARFKSDKNEWGPISSTFFSILTRPVLSSSVTDSLRFGTISSGRDSVTKSFYVRNAGDADLKLKVASKPSTQWTVKMYAPRDTVAKDSIIIAKDSYDTDSALVAVMFRPVKAGVVKNAIQFAVNDSVKPTFTLPVAAQADTIVPKLAWTADTLKFGQRTVGTSTFLSVTLSNVGQDTLYLSAGAASLPYTAFPMKTKLAPNNPSDTTRLTIRFAPSSQGTYNNYVVQLTVRNKANQFIESKVIYFTGSAIINPNPTIYPSMSSLDFGAISARSVDNKDTSISITLGNVGTQTLNIKSVVSSDTAIFKPTINSTLPINVAFNGVLQVTMKFKPAANTYKVFEGSLTVRSNSLNADSVLVIPMKGEGTNGPPLNAMALSDTSLDYGSVTIGFNTTKNIVISNKGAGVNKTLNVTGLSLNNGVFTTTQSVPFQIGPDSTKTIAVKFAPSSTGPVTGSLFIESDAATRPTRTVELKGNGVITPQPLFETAMSPLAFSPTKVATPNAVYFKYKNSGNDTLRADSIFMVKKTSFFTVNKSKALVAPGKTDSVLVTFTPLAVASYTDSLIFISNLNPPRTGIYVTGNGAVLSIGVDTNVTPINPSVVGGNQPQQIGVSLSASLGSGATAYLYYKTAGATQYDSVQMSTADGIRFQATIPGTIVGDRGAVYYVRISNGVESVSLPPSFVAVEYPTGIVKSQDQPAGTKQSNYRMISVPLTMNSSAVDTVLKNFGAYDKNKWRLFRYQGGDYVEHTSPLFQTFAPGRGYWFITSTPQKIRSGGGKATSASSAFSIDLQSEWNQIGDPFNFPVSWDSVTGKVTSIGALFDYNGVDFVQTSVMQPWVGYFVKNTSVNPVTIGIRPVEPGTPAVLPKMAADGAPMLANGEWMVQLSASAGETEDRYNFAGMKKDAAEEFDANDVEESPKQPGEFLKLRFANNGWKVRPDAYGSDFRPVNAKGNYWDMELATNTTADAVAITADRLATVPANFRVMLIDAEGHAATDLRRSSTVTIPSTKKEMTRPLRLVVGTDEFVAQNSLGVAAVPTAFSLEQNYPNPFNPSTAIRFALPSVSTVRLTIYDVLGKQVTTLANGVMPDGYHLAMWNGTNDAGRMSASGVYLCRIDARAVDGSRAYTRTIKMILMK